jgi:ABC-type nickel/cobalt efflux system permease component RcnA
MLVSSLKLKYQLLTHLISVLCIGPTVVILISMEPLIKNLEEALSREMMFGIAIGSFILLITLNCVLVYFTYRSILRKYHPVTNEQFWKLAWAEWYPESWFKNGST